jgi:uncharacterized protein (DUF1778 family)
MGKEQRKPIAIRLSAEEIVVLKEAAKCMKLGWTTFVRQIAMVAAERIVELNKPVIVSASQVREIVGSNPLNSKK